MRSSRYRAVETPWVQPEGPGLEAVTYISLTWREIQGWYLRGGSTGIPEMDREASCPVARHAVPGLGSSSLCHPLSRMPFPTPRQVPLVRMQRFCLTHLSPAYDSL